MRGTLTLLIIACLLAFVASSKQHKDTKQHGPSYQDEHETHKVEHEEGSGVGSTYLGSGVSGSGEGKLILKPLRTRFRFAVNYGQALVVKWIKRN